MSKARLIITAVILEGRSQADVARDYNVSKSWVSKLIKRYKQEGTKAFEARSRKPHRSPTRAPEDTIEKIITLNSTGFSSDIYWRMELCQDNIQKNLGTGLCAWSRSPGKIMK